MWEAACRQSHPHENLQQQTSPLSPQVVDLVDHEAGEDFELMDSLYAQLLANGAHRTFPTTLATLTFMSPTLRDHSVRNEPGYRRVDGP